MSRTFKEMKHGSGFILGISNSHDAGVAIINDGEILGAVNEERLVREKQVAEFPGRCLEEIWAIAGVAPEDIEMVAIASASLGIPPSNNDFSHDDGSISFTQTFAEMLDRSPGGGICWPIAPRIRSTDNC